MEARAEEELSRCIIELLVKEPFLGHLLSGVMREVSHATPTAAVALGDDGVRLRINPDFLLGTLGDKAARVAVIKHECLHLLFGHLLRSDGLCAPVFNLAADLVVNQFVRPWALPDGAISLGTFPDLALPEDQTAEWYYDRLMALRAEMEAAGGSAGAAADLSRIRAPRSAAALAELVSARWHSDHDGWGAASSAAREAARGQLDRAIGAALDRVGPQRAGALPGPLRALIDAVRARRGSQIDWRRCVRIFGASSRRTRIAGTYRRESRRYGDPQRSGELGSPVQGIKVQQRARLAVALDTSASVGDEDLSRFFAEIRGMWCQGMQVDVVECDSSVQRVYPFRGRLPERVAGRGGTRFDPVFAWLREAVRRARYDGCIYLTDGGAPAPTIAPPCRLLWVLTPGGAGEHLRFGRVLRLPG